MKGVKNISNILIIGAAGLMCLIHIGCQRITQYQCADNGLRIEAESYGQEIAFLKIGDSSGQFTDTIYFVNDYEVFNPFTLSIPTDNGKDIYILSPSLHISRIGSHNYNIHEVKDYVTEYKIGGRTLWLDPNISSDREELYIDLIYGEIKKIKYDE